MKFPTLKSFLLLEAFVAVILLASSLLSNVGISRQTLIPTKTVQDGFTPLFDGKSLDGWEFDPVYWSVKEGAIVGEITPETVLKNNTFMIWKRSDARRLTARHRAEYRRRAY